MTLTKLKATNTADTIDSQDSNDSEVEFVHTGVVGFRDGPYIYQVSAVTPETIATNIAAACALFLEEFNKEPWTILPYSSYTDPKKSWYFIEDRKRQDKCTRRQNWLQVLISCNIPEGLARSHVVVRSGFSTFGAIMTADDTTFKNYLEKFHKGAGSAMPLPAIQCLKAIRCWARWFRFTTGRTPVSEDFTYEEAVQGWKRFTYETTLTVNKPTAPVAPEKFKKIKECPMAYLHRRCPPVLVQHSRRHQPPIGVPHPRKGNLFRRRVIDPRYHQP